MTLNTRISKILEYSKLSSSEFADEIDVQRSSVSHITSGRNKPSLEFIMKIKNRFPELSWDWIINGDGEMVQAENIEKEKLEEETTPKASSLPDLFSFIAEEEVKPSLNEKLTEKEKPRESIIPVQDPKSSILGDSQRLESKSNREITEFIGNQENKIKRIVLFYENGKFETFEP
jgi:transcriptional regulator with XRE-family HTH domain